MHSTYFVPIARSADFNSMRRRADLLSYNGFVVRELEYNDLEAGSVFRKPLSCLYAKVAMDAMDLSASIDYAVVFSGDAGITPMLWGFQRRGTSA
ncbi:PIN domain-containing protein [Halovulum sp. GXIMD14794]